MVTVIFRPMARPLFFVRPINRQPFSRYRVKPQAVESRRIHQCRQKLTTSIDPIVATRFKVTEPFGESKPLK
jgi:hypothetical protein